MYNDSSVQSILEREEERVESLKLQKDILSLLHLHKILRGWKSQRAYKTWRVDGNQCNREEWCKSDDVEVNSSAYFNGEKNREPFFFFFGFEQVFLSFLFWRMFITSAVIKRTREKALSLVSLLVAVDWYGEYEVNVLNYLFIFHICSP